MINLDDLVFNDEYTIPSGIFGKFIDDKLTHKDFICWKCNAEYKDVLVGQEPAECKQCGRKFLWR